MERMVEKGKALLEETTNIPVAARALRVDEARLSIQKSLSWPPCSEVTLYTFIFL